MTTNFVFVHGAMMGSFVWDELVAALKEGSDDAIECLMLDVPGCGTKLGRDVRDMPFDAIVEDLLTDIDASGISDAVLVGHSQGGTVLPRLIEARPTLFRKVVYIACLGPRPGLSVMDASEAGEIQDDQAVAATNMIEGIREMLCNDMDVVQTREFLGKLGGGHAWPPSSYAASDWRYRHLRNIDSTYIFCTRDQCVPPAKQEEYIGQLHIDRVIRLDSGHQPMNSRPDELAAILLTEAAVTMQPD